VKWCVVALAASLIAQSAFAQQVAVGPFGGRIGIEESIEQPGVLAEALDLSRLSTPPAVYVRLSIGWPRLARAAR